MKYIVIIPARGGSKRFPGKNITNLGGVPLITHSIQYALKLFDKSDVWVNTDSEEIAQIGLAQGVMVYKRDSGLADDFTTTAAVLKDQLSNMNFDKIDAVILLQPTNPIRPFELLKKAINLYESSGRSTLTTFSPLKRKYGKIENDVYYPTNYKIDQRSQDIENEYFENGLLYISSSKSILDGIIIAKDTYPLIVEDVSGNIDIDYPEDLIFANLLLKNHGQVYRNS